MCQECVVWLLLPSTKLGVANTFTFTFSYTFSFTFTWVKSLQRHNRKCAERRHMAPFTLCEKVKLGWQA